MEGGQRMMQRGEEKIGGREIERKKVRVAENLYSGVEK
jgi:hypothetical protein